MSDNDISKLAREEAYREAFLACIGTKLSASHTDWPTTRYWTMPSLKRLFRGARDELGKNGLRSNLTTKALLEWLSRIGIARELVTEGQLFHVFDIGADPRSSPDPFELLMAAHPSGVVCYFSSVAFHSLTTQQVAHHHVAVLEDPSPKQLTGKAGERPRRQTIVRPSSPAASSQRLGHLLFRHEGASFYATKRSSRLVPGVQLRGYGPRVNLRITTYEQTLIDTLYKPFHCGGPEVVFEAWQEARQSGRMDEEWLADYFERMNYPATARRTAVMLRLIGHIPGQALLRVLEKARESVEPSSEFARISLLPGVGYTNLDEEWLVHTP